MKKLLLNRLIGHIRQLCSLNLDGAVTIPAALSAIRQGIGADWAGFVWADKHGMPDAFHCENEDVYTTWPHYESLRLAGKVSPIIGDFQDWMTLRKPPPNSGEIDKRLLLSSCFFNEVVKPTQTHHFFKVVIRHNNIGLGHTLMGRSSPNHPFSAEESAFIRSLNQHLAHAIMHPAGLTDDYLDNATSAIILTDHRGNIIHQSLSARQTLALAIDNTYKNHDLNKIPPQIIGLIKQLQLIDQGKQVEPAIAHTNNRWGRFVWRAYAVAGHTGSFFFHIQHQKPRQLTLLKGAFNSALSVQQQVICIQLVNRQSHKQISKQLNVKENTVIDHVRSIYRKLEVHNIQELERKLLIFGA